MICGQSTDFKNILDKFDNLESQITGGLETTASALAANLNVDLKGKHAVVIGRCNIVGKPMAQLLLKESCTVTIAHSKTKNLPQMCKEADILVGLG